MDYGERIALGIKGLYGWREITYKGLSLLAEKTARYLIEDLEFKKEPDKSGTSLKIILLYYNKKL